jgi:hypothetical protein
MTGFDPLARITLGYIFSNFSFHSGPPEVLSEILIHFGTTKMNREFR